MTTFEALWLIFNLAILIIYSPMLIRIFKERKRDV
jgi:hypothetical protein